MKIAFSNEAARLLLATSNFEQQVKGVAGLLAANDTLLAACEAALADCDAAADEVSEQTAAGRIARRIFERIGKKLGAAIKAGKERETVLHL